MKRQLFCLQTPLTVAVLLITAGIGAETVPTGVQENFVLGWERHIWDMMDEVQNDHGGAQFAITMNSVVTATASADNQVIYYDHWEDNLDPELDNSIGGSTEILSRQAVEAARSYSVPIGEDLYIANTVTEPFHFVHLNLVAFADTQITVYSAGVGTVSFDLDRGEHWSSQGYIDAVTQPTLAIQINSGTKVSTTDAIAGMVFTDGDATWATRHYALLPDILHSTNYITTAPGDDPTAGPTTNGTSQDRPANIYILNPDEFTDIDVNITDSSGSYSITIPSNSMQSMQDLTPGRDIAPNSTVRITSARRFWGITAYDYGNANNDWGHSWLARKFLTRAYIVGHAPQNSSIATQPELFNPVYVAATQDNTLVNFDLNNDGIYDQVDLNGDGAPDVAPQPGNTYVVSTPAALMVFDPGLPPGFVSDREMTGTRIISNKPIAVSWGQETDLAIGRLPAQSAAELADYRDKIAVFESANGEWKKHTLWLADDDDLGGEFTTDIESLISELPSDFTFDRVLLDDLEVERAWQLTLDNMTKGAVVTNFLGHGGFDRLSDEGLMVTDEAATMENHERTPFLTALSCILGRFDVPGYDTLSEALLLNPNGDAIAVWSPSAYALNFDSRLLGQYPASVIGDGGVPTIGEFIRSALTAYSADPEGNPDLAQKFILPGDPATRVDW